MPKYFDSALKNAKFSVTSLFAIRSRSARIIRDKNFSGTSLYIRYIMTNSSVGIYVIILPKIHKSILKPVYGHNELLHVLTNCVTIFKVVKYKS